MITAVSIAAMALAFTPKSWAPFIVGTLIAGLVYGAIGALSGAVLGRLGAVYFMFFLPNIDIGIAQDPIFFDGDPQGCGSSWSGSPSWCSCGGRSSRSGRSQVSRP